MESDEDQNEKKSYDKAVLGLISAASLELLVVGLLSLFILSKWYGYIKDLN